MSDIPKILVVEDNDFVRMQIVRYLTDAGFSVLEAADGKTGQEVAFADLSLIVADVRMEPVDGFEFVKALQTKGLKIPVIFVTGDQNPDMLAEASRLGVTAVLMKPVQKDRLVQMVSREIEKHKRLKAQNL